MRTKKERLNPNGAENCGFREFSRRLKRADKRRMSRVFIAAGRDLRNSATVFDAFGVGVDALVQLR
jgi:hypothetical protein